MKEIQAFLQKPYLYILIVLIGTVLKFYKLNDQFFWDDEVCTILHTTGISMAEYGRNLPVNEIVNKETYLDLLTINDKDFSIFDQIIGLTKMPQLTPGHYYYLIFWTRLFGDGLKNYRYFSVLMYILALPFLFLLARKLFKSDLAGWLAISFYSVSAFFQFYAQEARYYILWSFALILIHYLFLMAVEKQNRKWWIIYIVAGFLAVHVSILTYAMYAVHGIYYFIFHKEKWKPLVLSLLLIFLSSVPWLFYIYINRNDIHNALSWQSHEAFGEQKIINLLKSHERGLTEVFINLYWHSSIEIIKILSRWLPRILIVLSLVLLYWKADKQQKWFISLISFVGVLSFIAIDLFRGSFTSMIIRYHLLYYAGFILIASYGFSVLIKWKPLLFGFIFLVFIAGGIFSSKFESDDFCGRKRNDCYYHIADAPELFSGSERILIISDFQVINPYSYTAFMSLLIRSENDNIDVLYSKPEYPDFREEINFKSYDKVYAMYLTEDLRNYLHQLFSEEELVIEKDRTLYGSVYLPVYSIHPSNKSEMSSENSIIDRSVKNPV